MVFFGYIGDIKTKKGVTTMENYEEKYKQAIERAKNYCDGHHTDVSPKAMSEYLFPELKESEDDIIKEVIHNLIVSNDYTPSSKEIFSIYGKTKEDCIAWLEKQGEKPNNVCDKELSEILGRVIRRYINDPNIPYTEREKVSMEIIPYVERLEKQGEQKLIEQDTETRDLWEYIREFRDKFGRLPKDEDELAACIDYVIKRQKPVYKVEPKFKVGDWVVHDMSDGRKVIRQIINMTNKSYVLDGEDFNTFYFNDLENDYHLWTIQDAKDGDVLATKNGNPFIYDKNRYNNGLAYYYAGLDVNKELTLKNPHNMLAHFGELRSVFPATEEQRDTLERAMTNAGYRWNKEELKLEKI